MQKIIRKKGLEIKRNHLPKPMSMPGKVNPYLTVTMPLSIAMMAYLIIKAREASILLKAASLHIRFKNGWVHRRLKAKCPQALLYSTIR